MPRVGLETRHHILSVLVENKPGVLARVAGLFSRRAYNIFSLAVSPTEDERLSRMTIVVDVESSPLEQIIRQLDKLINVVEISELAPQAAVERELMLVTVCCEADLRSHVTELVSIFEAKILDFGWPHPAAGRDGTGSESMTLMLAGTPDKLDALEHLLRPFGIVELQRTGRIALPKLRPTPAALREVRSA